MQAAICRRTRPLRLRLRAVSQKPARRSRRQPSEYLRQLYFDSMVFTPEGLRHLVAECGVSQIMIGTDYPFPVEHHDRGSRFQHAWPERRRQAGDPGRERGTAAEDPGLTQKLVTILLWAALFLL